jgi:UDP-glucuronate decarboxylase
MLDCRLQQHHGMQRILVTGGAGFLGAHVCDRLVREGHHVVALDDLSTGTAANLAAHVERRTVKLLIGDVVDPIPIDADAIIHLACPASPAHYQRDPCRTLRTAVRGTESVLERARELRIPVLIASTSEIYGDPEIHPQPESYCGKVSTTGPRSCYDEGKRCSEALVAAYQQMHGVDARIARIFNTYGPRMQFDDGRVVSNFIVQALEGRPLTIYGHGGQTRSFCYVDDLVDGLLRLLSHPANPGPINLGNPEEYTIRELAEQVTRLVGRDGGIKALPMPADDPIRRRPDIERARSILGWHPVVPLTVGLGHTITDFRQRLGRLPDSDFEAAS